MSSNKILVEVHPHIEEGCTTIETENFGVSLRIGYHCPSDWNIQGVTKGALNILSTTKDVTADDVRKVVNKYFNPEVVEVI